MVTVYGLRDPRDQRIRYVGQTRMRPAVRVRGHLAEVSIRPETAKSRWLGDLASSGAQPEFVCLEICRPSDADRVEAAFIRLYTASDDALNQLEPRAVDRDDDVTMLQIRFPLWMKRRVVEIATSKGKDISEWLRDLILGETGGRDEKPKKGGNGR